MGYSGHFENRDSMIAKLYELGLWRSGVRSNDNDRYFDTVSHGLLIYMSVDLESAPGHKLLNEFFVFEDGPYTLDVEYGNFGSARVTITDCMGHRRAVPAQVVPVGEDVLKDADSPCPENMRGDSIRLVDGHGRGISLIAHIKGTKDTVVFHEMESYYMTYTSAQLRAIADKMDEVSRYLRETGGPN